MGQQQLLLALGAITIFGLVTLSTNDSIMTTLDATYQQQIQLIAINVAQKYIERIKGLSYDEQTITKGNAAASDFTSPGLLGPDGEATWQQYDDVDDFDGFSTLDEDSTLVGPIRIDIQVEYVSQSDLEGLTSPASATYQKLVEVTANNRYLNSPVTLNYVYAYQRN